MATLSHVSMLREIIAAGDRARTGALDVEWDGARASLFFTFGHPSHLVFEGADGRSLVGDDALTALVAELPTEFTVAPWRRAMVTEDTLHLSAEDLVALFQADPPVAANGQQAANAQPAEPPDPDEPGAGGVERPDAASLAGDAIASGDGPAPPDPAVAEALTPLAPIAAAGHTPVWTNDFPLLPLGSVLFADAKANVASLEAIVPRLPDCLLVLAGPDLRAAALLAGGAVADAVWVAGGTRLLGDDAWAALSAATEGHLTAYLIDDPRLLAALPVLWRGPRLTASLPATWLHSDNLVAEVRTSGRTCALLVDTDENGAALFHDGELVAVYTTEHRRPSITMSALRRQLRQPEARVTIVGEGGEPPAPPRPAEEPEHALPTSDAVEEHASSAADGSNDSVSAAAQGSDGEHVGAATTDDEQTQGLGAGGIEDSAGTMAEDPIPTAELELAVGGVAADATDAPQVVAEAQHEPATAEPLAADTASATGTIDDRDPGAPGLQFEPAVLSIAALHGEEADEGAAVEQVDARAERDFVPVRLEVDTDALRVELTEMAVVWLGADDSAPVARAIAATRPGVDDFVATIAAIGTMEIPGHEHAVVRAMAREMHFRAAEVLCGV